MKYYLYNPLANNGIKPDLPGVDLIDASKIDYPEFFGSLKEEDEVVMVGGDGTINYLINHVDCEKIKNNIYILGAGTGNDFLNDINEVAGKEILLNPYIVNLPVATVKGKEYKYINNMSFGIDGYCCEEADRIFDNVWLAPAMKGRYCGGGMNLAPGQDRLGDHLTVIVYMSPSKIKSLKNFPLIFEGKHVALTDMVKVIEGKKVHVRFSRPCAVQIDGETILNVTEYWAEQK